MGSLEEMGFAQLKPAKKPLVMVVNGKIKHGKTRFGLTAAQYGPTAILNMDRGLDEVAPQVATPNPVFTEEFRWGSRLTDDEYKKDLDRFTEMHCKAVRGGAKVIVWDTVTKLYWLARMGIYGKIKGVRQTNYDEVYAYLNSLIFTVQDESDAHLIMLSQLKPEYKTDSSGFGTPTGKWVPAAPAVVLESANVTVDLIWDGEGGNPNNYTLRVHDCRPNPSLIGLTLTGDMATFPVLLSMIYPE